MQLLASALFASAALAPTAFAAPSNHKSRSPQEQPATTPAEYGGYLFAYFEGSSLEGENIYFAVSEGNDALHWRTLNADGPAITSSEGTGGLRDPFLIRSPDGSTFYMIATDLSIGSGTSWDEAVRNGSRYLEVWDTQDLRDWGEQRHVLVSPPEAGNTWAPEAFFDESLGEYIVFWASSLYDEETDPAHAGDFYHRMFYATTPDFVTFGEPQIWQDAGTSRIDSTILQEGDTYYRFTKDEGGASTGCVDNIQEHSTELRAGLDAWTTDAQCIGSNAGLEATEGPTAFKSNPGDVNGEKYYLFLDEFGGRGYVPLETEDIANPDWQLSAEYDLPANPRHGTVLPITAEELAALTQGQ